MGEQDKQGVVAASSGIKVGENKPRRSLRAKLFGMGVGMLAIILLIAAGAFMLVHHFHSPAKHVQTSEKPLTPAQQAANLQVAGNYVAAQQIYDTQLKSAKTAQEKAQIYTGKATVSFTAKDYASALSYAGKADKLAPTAYTAEFLGNIAKAQGDVAAAQTYFQSALHRLNPKTSTYGYVANKIQAEIDGVNQ
jgi:tetratricopeptide (TPR) repeat protein